MTPPRRNELSLLTDCLRGHMDILISEHSATGMTFVQISRPGDDQNMIAVSSLKSLPIEAIRDACEQALVSGSLSPPNLDANDGVQDQPITMCNQHGWWGYGPCKLCVDGSPES